MKSARNELASLASHDIEVCESSKGTALHVVRTFMKTDP